MKSNIPMKTAASVFWWRTGMMLKGDKLLKYILIHGLEQNPASWEKTIKDIA